MSTRKNKIYRMMKHRLNKSQKNLLMTGGESSQPSQEQEETNSLINALGTSAKTALVNTAKLVEDEGARLLGYVPKTTDNQRAETNNQPSELSKKAEELKTTASNIASGILNKANQVGAIVINELNKKIEGPINDTITSAMGRTVDATKDILVHVNEKLNEPEFINTVAETTKNITEKASEIIEITKPAINEAIDKVSDVAQKVGAKFGESAISIGLNTVQAVPGVGVAVGLIRDADKLATAATAAVEAGSKTVEILSNSIVKAEEAIKNKMAETSEIKKRISNGIDTFNKADDVANRLGLKNYSNQTNQINQTNQTNQTNQINQTNQVNKKGGRPSRKFRKAKRRLSRRLRFRLPDSSSK